MEENVGRKHVLNIIIGPARRDLMTVNLMQICLTETETEMLVCIRMAQGNSQDATGPNCMILTNHRVLKAMTMLFWGQICQIGEKKDMGKRNIEKRAQDIRSYFLESRII